MLYTLPRDIAWVDHKRFLYALTERQGPQLVSYLKAAAQ